ncbi:hypothetical protein PENARI_c066G06364 [Penicillium arizonense]|uniref:Xylanolytic transcriptional activator regulatory domain-containing protein n=1 Tax=Penicillium arizonense TaxID=1835702 RepID=A0A1F5L1K7_PENAI|nr:hypothetical protein PENARI_c066G06364 [Penicillium arizonense]OGE47085.1 hypothetical protein PENARI_c066G06364 [Penicillium arizonense]
MSDVDRPEPIAVAAIVYHAPQERKSSHSCFALPGEVSLRQADCVLQKALVYAPSGSNDIACHYGDRKREKIDKQLNDLNARVDVLERLIRDIYPTLDIQSAQHVDRTLCKISSHAGGLSNVPEPAVIYNTQGPPVVTIDYTEEDFNCRGEIQALGFVGEHSEMVWLYRLKCAIKQSCTTPSTSQEDLIRSSVASMDYYQNDCEIAMRDEVDLLVRPSQSMADQLVDNYFEIIHPSFPIIGKTTFVGQYRSFYRDPTAQPGKQWLAVLNLVFATAAMHMSLVKTSDMDKAALRDHPNLQQVQVEGLAAFYLLASGQVNRSWKCCGIAIRSALIMGLNLRSESQSVAPLSKEIRYRVWWALYTLETSLSVTTGRPPSTSEVFRTTPLPMPFRDEILQRDHVLKYTKVQPARSCLMATLCSKGCSTFKDSLTDGVPLDCLAVNKRSPNKLTALMVAETQQPNDNLSLLYGANLTVLMREAIDSVYAPGSAHKSWSEMESMISSLNEKADNWLDTLPATYQFKEKSISGVVTRQHISLALHFYSTKLFILQPCLRGLLHKTLETSERSSMASDTMPVICIQSACQLLDILPDEPDVTWLYRDCPWWCALHYIMQSITIILTECFIRTKLGKTDTMSIVPRFRKARAWLKEMSKTDDSARKAWFVCMDFIICHGSELGLDADDSL